MSVHISVHGTPDVFSMHTQHPTKTQKIFPAVQEYSTPAQKIRMHMKVYYDVELKKFFLHSFNTFATKIFRICMQMYVVCMMCQESSAIPPYSRKNLNPLLNNIGDSPSHNHLFNSTRVIGKKKPKGSGQSENSKYMQRLQGRQDLVAKLQNDVLYLQINIARTSNDNAV